MENINLARRISLEVDREKQGERENIARIYNSNISCEEKLVQLKRRKAKFCRETLNEINPEKYFILTSASQTRKFYMKDFDARNSDYINIENQIRIHLDLALNIRTIESVFWFEHLVKCLVRGSLPLFYSDGKEIPVKVYLTSKKFELIKILKGEIQNPIESRQDLNYIKQNLSPNIQNLIRYYNLTKSQPWPLGKKSTSSFEIQSAIGIKVPIDIDRNGVDKDMIVYARSTLDITISEGESSKKAYKALNFTKPPKTIANLFDMDRRENTIKFNENQYQVRKYLIHHPENICTTIGGDSETISHTGLYTKVKYIYMSKGIAEELPTDLSSISIDMLQRILVEFA